MTIPYTKEQLFKANVELMERNRKLKEDRNRFEEIILRIANIDAIFMNGDGSERDWNDKEVLEEIGAMVTPVMIEYVKKSRENN